MTNEIESGAGQEGQMDDNADLLASVVWWRILPGTWVRHADRLRLSAELLWEPLARALTLNEPFSQRDLELWHHSYAFLLVAGTSLEVIFKAAAMQAAINKNGGLRRGLLKADLSIQNWILTHDLLKLAARADIQVSEEDKAQLERFTKYIQWAGSYPVPKDAKDPRPEAVTEVDYRVSDVDHVWLDRFYARAHEKYLDHLDESKRTQAPTNLDSREL